MGYAYQATVTVPAPTGGPHANFTFLLKGSDALLKLASLGTGGAIQNSISRAYGALTQTVPADLVLSTDSGITSLMTWGIDNWDSTNGVIWIWVKITSYSAGFTIYVSIGNPSVTLYQGGAVGSEFDANVRGAWHLSNGSVLSGIDFSSFGHNMTVGSSVSATAGKIDGAASFPQDGTANNVMTGADSTDYNVANITLSAWIKTPATATQPENVIDRDNIGAREFQYRVSGNKIEMILFLSGTPQVLDSTASVNDNLWHYVVGTWDGTTMRTYVDGAASGSATFSGTLSSGTGGALRLGAYGGNVSAQGFGGTVDEARIASTARSANWIATEYANQSGPPSMGAFSPISSGAPSSLTLLGCQ